MIKIKRVYDEPNPEDGYRILVDRLWPRGLSKDRAKIDLWLKDIAPSGALRQWFGHDPKEWAQFKRRYYEELKDKKELVKLIGNKGRKGVLTLLFGAKEETYNNAASLKEYIETTSWKISVGRAAHGN